MQAASDKCKWSPAELSLVFSLNNNANTAQQYDECREISRAYGKTYFWHFRFLYAFTFLHIFAEWET